MADMTKDQEVNDEQTQEVPIICPTCKKQNKLKIPVKIINQSKQLTTVSIPTGIVCEHTFQAFIDKNFKVRGYQKIDYELAKMEFYEGGTESVEGVEAPKEQKSTLSSLPIFQDIIKILRNSIDDKEILGSGLFTTDGKVLYSSLDHSTLLSTIREFEVREKKKLTGVKKMMLQLENNEKICAEYIQIFSSKFVLVLFYAPNIKLGMASLLLTRLAEKIANLT